MKNTVKKTAILLFGLVAQIASAQFRLTENTQVSLITEGPGIELYSSFGHSAIWIFDPQLGIDRSYNYGVFDTSDPLFYVHFTQGRMNYMIAQSPLEYMRYTAVSENRYLLMQELNLTASQKNRLFDFLEWNALPENRVYPYQFFYDNCSTRLRDVMRKILGDTLQFHPGKDFHKSFRNLTDEYLQERKWGDLGIDIGLGLPTDKIATPDQYMFLPEYLAANFDSARIAMNGSEMPLVKERRILITQMPQKAEFDWFSPVTLFWGLFLLAAGLTFFQWKKQRFNRTLDVILFLITGLVGAMLVFLWFFTDHADSAQNFNLLWAVPFNLIAAFALFSRRLTQKMRGYWLTYAGLEVLLLLTWAFLPQNLNEMLIPVVLTMLVRSGFLFWKSRQIQKSARLVRT
jgi:hypothetical protein